MERIEKFGRSGRLSSAARALNELAAMEVAQGVIPSPASALSMDAMRTLIAALYPQRPTEVIADNGETVTSQQKAEVRELTSVVQLDKGDIVKAFYKLDPDSAQGMSGWTNGLIRNLFGKNGRNGLEEDVEKYLIPLFNKILRGKLPRTFWTSSRATFIPKSNDPGQYRPLGIGEVWYRFFGKSLMQHFAEVITPAFQTGADFLPLQLGCCVRGGCEIAARTCQLAYDSCDDNIIVSLDIKNAYQTVKRSEIMAQLLNKYRTLAPLFEWAYGDDSPLFLANGTSVGYAYTGVKQGDPLGAFFFCHGLQPALKEIEERVARASELSNHPPQEPLSTAGLNLGGIESGTREVGILAYIDDINLFTHVNSAVAVAKIAKEVLARYGFTLSTRKCYFLGRQAELLKDELDFQIAVDGLKILGNPVGSVNFRIQSVGEILRQQLQPLASIHHIRHLTALAFQILRKCINSRPNYLSRIVEPHGEVNHLFQLFDLHVNAAITCLSGYRSRPGIENFWDIHHLVMTPFLRSLPTSLGGLGMPLHGGLAGALGCLRSRAITHRFLDRNSAYAPLVEDLSNPAKLPWKEVKLMESKDIRHWQFFQTGESALANSWFATQVLRQAGSKVAIFFPKSWSEAKRLFARDSTNFGAMSQSQSQDNFLECASSSEAVSGRLAERGDVSLRAALEAIADSKEIERVISDQHRQDQQWLLQELRVKLKWFDCAAWLLHSSYDKSGAIFNKIDGAGYFEGLTFTQEEFKETLNMRLMLPQFQLLQDTDTDSYVCDCGAYVDLCKERFHCLGCTEMQKIFNTRHAVVVKRLNEAMHNEKLPFVIPLSGESGVRKEYQLPIRDDASNRRADLGFVGANQVRFVVDVAIMAPTARSYTNVNQYAACQVKDGAHVHIERQKERRYESHIHPESPSSFTYSLIPFIIDCTGNMGADTIHFFREQNMTEHRRKVATRRVQSVVAVYSARIRKGHSQLHIPPVNAAGLRIREVGRERLRKKRGRPPLTAEQRAAKVSRGTRNVAAVNGGGILESNDGIMPTESATGALAGSENISFSIQNGSNLGSDNGSGIIYNFSSSSSSSLLQSMEPRQQETITLEEEINPRQTYGIESPAM